MSLSMTTTQARVLECPGCAATYRLPPNFSAPKARCKKCGSVMTLGSSPHRPVTGQSRRAPTGGSRRLSPSRATQAVRERGRRSTIAMGHRQKQPLSGLHVLAGVATLGILVVFLIFAL